MVILETLGLSINLGSSTFSHMFPALKLLPTTARTSPETCFAYSAEISCQAFMDAGSFRSHSGILMPFDSIIPSSVVPPFPFAISNALSAPPIPLLFPDQKKAVFGSVLTSGDNLDISIPLPDTFVVKLSPLPPL